LQVLCHVTVTEIQPKRAISPKHAEYLAKYTYQRFDIFIR